MIGQRFKSLAKDILYFGLGNMLYSIVQFFSMPLIVKTMDKGQVANWNILLPTGLLLAAIVTFGMDAAVVRFVKDVDSEKDRKTIFSTGFFFELTLALLVVGSMWIFSAQLRESINLSANNENAWYVLALWVPAVVTVQFFQNWFKYSFKRKIFIFLVIIQSVSYLGVIIYLKLTEQVNLYNVMLAMLISQVIVALIGFIYCRKLFVLAINKKLLGQLIIYGLPFMLIAFGYNFINAIDRYMLVSKLTEVDFAIYSQAFRISAIISMVVSSFNFAFNPFLLSILGQEQVPETLGRFHTYYLMVMSFMGLSFLALSRIIIQLLAGADYIDGQKYMLMFVLGYTFFGMYAFAQAGIIYSKRSYIGLYALAAGLATVFVVDLLTVDRFGGFGTSTGFATANIVMVIFAALFSTKYVPIRYSVIKDVILLMLLIGGGILFSTSTFSESLITDAIFKLAIVMVGGGILYFALLSPTDKSYLKNIFAKKKSFV
jgi:O-antigen/teichoic acid export membrane protein